MNAMVDTGAAAFADGGVNWLSDTIKAQLADSSFTPTYDAAGNINNAQFLSTVLSSLVGTAVTLASKTSAAGVLNAANPVFPLVVGATAVRVWVWKDTGVAGTSQLLFAFDAGAGFPVIPIGGDITLRWDTGAISRIAGVARI